MLRWRDVETAVLALDVGTSSCRASLYDQRGQMLQDRFAHVTYSPTVTPDGGAELDPDLLFDRLCSVIDQVLGHKSGPRIEAVATDTFWHGLLGVDERGTPVTPLYPWLDSRSRDDARRLREQLSERAVHARVGCVLHWTYWPAKLSWLRRTQPDLFKRVARWISFGELFLERTTGQRAVSASMASGTGLLNVHTCEWDQEMLAAAGIDRNRLSPIVPLRQASTANAETANRWPGLDGVPWIPAVGDGACSNIGAGCTTRDRFALMIGTSGAERAVWSPEAAFEIPWGTWCYRVDERRVVMGGAFNDGGSLFAWLRHSLQLPSLRKAERAIATLEPDGHGLTVLPFWGGERSTGWADDARGAIVGLRLHTSPVEILRACFEAIALRFAELDGRLLSAIGANAQIVGTGGALLHSPTWMQIVADVLGRPLLASSQPEASSRGASLLALEAVGRLGRPLERFRPSGRRVYQPVQAHTEIYRAAAERQRRLYDALIT